MSDGDRWFFDLLSPAYDLVMPPADRDALAAGLVRAERDVDRVVDVGGGTGRAIAALDAPDRIVVDASAGMLSRVPTAVTAVRGDAARLPLVDGATDAVLIVDALHHFPAQDAAIREAARVLGPGGVLVVREFDRGSVRGRLLELGEHALGMESSFRTVDEIVDAVAAAGLEPVVAERGFACTVVGRKPGAT